MEAEPGLRAKVTEVPLTAGRSLATLSGTVAEVTDAATAVGDAWLRIEITEAARAGLADEVRELIGPSVVEVRLAGADHRHSRPRRRRRDGRSSSELFADYLEERSVADPRLGVGFDLLLDAVHGDDELPLGQPFLTATDEADEAGVPGPGDGAVAEQLRIEL